MRKENEKVSIIDRSFNDVRPYGMLRKRRSDHVSTGNNNCRNDANTVRLIKAAGGKENGIK